MVIMPMSAESRLLVNLDTLNLKSQHISDQPPKKHGPVVLPKGSAASGPSRRARKGMQHPPKMGWVTLPMRVSAGAG